MTLGDRVHLCDITMFWGPASGGVRRYIEAKRAYVHDRPSLRHSLFVPGARPAMEGSECCRINTVPAPLIPAGHGYRFPLRIEPWVDAVCTQAPDLIEVGDPYRLAWAGLNAGARLDVPVVGFVHSDLQRLTSVRLGRWTRWAVRRYLQHLYGRFDWVFAPSQVMADQVRQLGLERVSAHPLGVDTRLFTPRRRDPGLRKRLGLPEDARLLVFAGRNAREKNLPILIEAVQRLGAPYHLLLIGPDMPRSDARRVAIIDYVADTAVLANLLASADALVHAGDMETFGLVLLEAMASGLPVVGVDSGAVPELVDEQVGRLARPHDAASLAEAIEDVFASDRVAMGQAARARAVSGYDWAASFDRMHDRYVQLRATGQIHDDLPVVGVPVSASRG